MGDMGRKTGKSRKKYWKSKELADKTNELTELSRANQLKKQIESKTDSELFVVDTSKQWCAPEGVYSASKESTSKSVISNRSEIDEWTHNNEKYKKKPKFSAKDLDKNLESARVYDFASDMWNSSLSCKRKTVSKPNANEHVNVPLGGDSYNPKFSDHQELLNKVLSREQDEENERIAEKKFWDSIPAVTHEEKEEAVMEGVENFYFKQQLCDDGSNITEDSDNPVKTYPPLSNRKLKMTPKQLGQMKRKINAEIQIQTALKKDKLKNARENEILHAKSINKRLSKIEQLQLLKWKAKQSRKNDPKRIRMIGRNVPEQLKSSFKLTEELPGSLRTLVPESDSLISERLESMIKRNIIEPMPLTRAKTTARQRMVEKRRHKKNFRNVYNQTNQSSEVEAT